MATALLSLVLYASCLAPTVTYGGDCGELIAASYRLGIAHPSGYPFYCVLGRLWADLIPFGEVGWRYNLLSAALGAAGVGLVAATAHRLLWEPERARSVAFSAGGAALLLAGFFYYGSQSTITEVYSLNAFFLALLLWHAVSWLLSGDWRHFYALALSFGLSLTAHLSGLFLGPALLGIAILAPRERFSPFASSGSKKLAAALALCAVGFALTAYLPIRSRLFPLGGLGDASHFAPLDWGHPADFASWKAHVTAKQYGRLLFVPGEIHVLGRSFAAPVFQQPLSLWPTKVATLLSLMATWLLVAAPLVPLGFVAPIVAARRARKSQNLPASTCRADLLRARAWVSGSLAAAWALNVGVQINYDVNDIVNFFFPAYIAQAVWLALGLDAAARWLSNLTAKWKPLPRWRALTLAKMALPAIVAVQWAFFLGASNARGETLARDRAVQNAAALEELQQESGARPVALIYSNDALWSFWYAQYVLGRASQTSTPWGALASEDLRREPQDKLVARLRGKQNAPVAVAVAEWDDRLDARFPLKFLASSADLCLATQRELPEPATPIVKDETPRAPGAILSAKVRRTKIARVPWDKTARSFEEALLKMPSERILEARGSGVPALKRGNIAPLDLEFTRPAWPALSASQREGAAHVGWLQVLAARAGSFDDAPEKAPPARSVREEVPRGEAGFVHATDAQVSAWTQSRRLVVPASSKPGALLKAEFPLTIEAYAANGLFEVWARLVRDKSDSTTPWQRVDLIELSHK